MWNPQTLTLVNQSWGAALYIFPAPINAGIICVLRTYLEMHDEQMEFLSKEPGNFVDFPEFYVAKACQHLEKLGEKYMQGSVFLRRTDLNAFLIGGRKEYVTALGKDFFDHVKREFLD
jgi:hypothetical protein